MGARAWAGGLLAAGALVGCPGTLDDPARFLACPDVPTVILQRDCLGSGCHGAADRSGGLDLQSPDLPSRLVGKRTAGGLSLLIDPGAPEKSAIYSKLGSPPFGSRMPLGQPALDAKTQACVLAWVSSFATPKDAGSDAPADASDASDAGRDLSTDPARFGLNGPSRCASASVQLCEDFETGLLDATTWKVAGAAPTIDSVHAARGLKALHVSITGDGQSAIRESRTFPAPNDTYFGRAFVYFASLPTAPGMSYAHWTFVAASGTGVSGEIRLSGQLSGGRNLFGVGTDNRVDDAGTGDWTTSDDDPANNPTPVPIGRWVCVEWMHAGATNETRFFWDGVEHPSLHTTASVHGGNANPFLLPNFTSVWLGWQEYQASTEPFELWIDEIAIDPERIGCPL